MTKKLTIVPFNRIYATSYTYRYYNVIILFTEKSTSYCGMYIPLSDDEHRFVQKFHIRYANGHWEHGRNSNSVATSHAAVVLYATI